MNLCSQKQSLAYCPDCLRFAMPPLSQWLRLSKWGETGGPEITGYACTCATRARSSVWMISVHLIHVYSTWLKNILIQMIKKKKRIRSYYSVSKWAWKTSVIFGNPDVIIPWNDGGNCHQNILGLGMNWKSDSQLHIVVDCRQFNWFRPEDTKNKIATVIATSEIQAHVNCILKLYLSLYKATNGLTNSW